MAIWRHFFGRYGVPSQEDIVAALTSAGVETRSLEIGSPVGGGLLFFDEPSEQVCDLLREVSRNGIDRVLAVSLAGPELEGRDGWRLLQSGASDVLTWNRAGDPAREVSARFERWSSVDALVGSPLVQHNLVGRSPSWTLALRQVVEAARFTDAPVLITGESGTGKELGARLIHTLDPRPDKSEMVILDCTTIVPELSGSEFYGHERGAFTGAVTARDGSFALADKGTLFLDEVGELPLGLQAGLLRVVQEGAYKRVGSNTWKHTSFRLVCATNRNLLDEEARGRFRRDFYHRIAGWTCNFPPLSQRRDDILPLAHHFIDKLRPGRPLELDPAVSDYLLGRDYPGNVRDLKKIVEQMVQRHVGDGPVTIGDVPVEQRPDPDAAETNWRDESFDGAIRRAIHLGVKLKDIGRAAEETAERIAVDEEDGNLQRAAQRLGVTDRALQMRRAMRRGQ
ncbi:MAG TPA: sigma 54-interacting transcriptional regulator [Blastocatellia bacterium]|nr:sigma 54-interacting transcriptional regulator [Blastocatellia bacterium]